MSVLKNQNNHFLDALLYMNRFGGQVTCEKCTKIISPDKLVKVQGKKRELHYCSEICLLVHRNPGNIINQGMFKALYGKPQK